MKDEYTLEAVPEARLKFVRDENGRIKELRVLNDRENGKYQNDSNSPHTIVDSTNYSMRFHFAVDAKSDRVIRTLLPLTNRVNRS